MMDGDGGEWEKEREFIITYIDYPVSLSLSLSLSIRLASRGPIGLWTLWRRMPDRRLGVCA